MLFLCPCCQSYVPYRTYHRHKKRSGRNFEDAFSEEVGSATEDDKFNFDYTCDSVGRSSEDGGCIFDVDADKTSTTSSYSSSPSSSSSNPDQIGLEISENFLDCILPVLRLKIKHNWTDNATEDVLKLQGVSQSIKSIRKELQELTGYSMVLFDCCINSCMLFDEETHCLYCHEPRFGKKGTPVNSYIHFSVVKWLQYLYGSSKFASLMKYRSDYEGDGSIKDVFDGLNYKENLLIGKSVC